jgi:hypothetical protein
MGINKNRYGLDFFFVVGKTTKKRSHDFWSLTWSPDLMNINATYVRKKEVMIFGHDGSPFFIVSVRNNLAS